MVSFQNATVDQQILKTSQNFAKMMQNLCP